MPPKSSSLTSPSLSTEKPMKRNIFDWYSAIIKLLSTTVGQKIRELITLGVSDNSYQKNLFDIIAEQQEALDRWQEQIHNQGQKIQELREKRYYDTQMKKIIRNIHTSSCWKELLQYVINYIPKQLWLTEYQYYITNTAKYHSTGTFENPMALFYTLVMSHLAENPSEPIQLHEQEINTAYSEKNVFPLVLRNYFRPEWALTWKEETVWYLHIEPSEKNSSLNKKYITESISMIMEAVGNYLSHLQSGELINILNKIVTTDNLTGISNRLDLFRKGKQLQAEVPEWSYLVAMLLDIDNFKTVNDTYGHKTGDMVLQTIAKIWQDHFKNGVFARFGWEEFAGFYIVDSKAEAKQVVEELRKKIEVAKTTWLLVSPTASIGIIITQNPWADLDDLLVHADHVMYQAKNTGKNRVCIWDPINTPKGNWGSTTVRHRKK